MMNNGLKVELVSVEGKELAQKQFVEELQKFVGTYTCVDLIGSVSVLHQYKDFDFYTYENETTFEDFIALGNADAEDLDFTICLDSVQAFLQDPITGTSLLTMDNGLQIHIWNDQIL